MDETNLKQSTACCREGEDAPTVIGSFTICTNGLVGGYRGARQPVRREQVEIVKEFLRECRPTRWARNLLSPVSSDLKHWVENWAGPYISTGAAIVAALELGFICVPTGEGSRNVLIGVHLDDVSARMAERGWYIARDHMTATRIKQPEPEPETDPAEERHDVVDVVVEEKLKFFTGLVREKSVFGGESMLAAVGGGLGESFGGVRAVRFGAVDAGGFGFEVRDHLVLLARL